MMKPVKYKILIAAYKIEYLIIILWTFSIANGLPVYYGVLNKSDLKNPVVQLLSLVYVTYTFIIPCIASWAAYIKMFVEAYRGRRMDASQGTEEARHRVSQWENEITRTLLVIIVVQTACSVPHMIYHMIACFKDVSSGSDAIHTIQCIQFLVDPLVFVTRAREYRNAVVQMFGCIAKKRPDTSTLEEDHVDPTNIVCADKSALHVALEMV
ncbi:melanocortin receptor 5-like [Macrobrachium rosenbergii]|uniref:melanocortin receptor 5-like n=1 Tax=Macrobrachium rosenbergii TaxID=79674 RepID=UPI0034D6C0A1